MSGNPFDPFNRKLSAFSRDLEGEGMELMLHSIGEQAKKDAEAAVRREIGDLSMSGWTHPRKGGARTEPPDLVARYEIPQPTRLEVLPGRKVAGPWRVLESGRNPYQAGDVRVKGTYTSKKTGLTKQRTRKVNRTVGATAGKGTWSDAIKAMAETVHDKGQEGLRKLVTRSFGG